MAGASKSWAALPLHEAPAAVPGRAACVLFFYILEEPPKCFTNTDTNVRRSARVFQLTISPPFCPPPRCAAWQVYSSAAYGRITEWEFTNPECNEKTEGFDLSEVSASRVVRERNTVQYLQQYRGSFILRMCLLAVWGRGFQAGTPRVAVPACFNAPT